MHKREPVVEAQLGPHVGLAVRTLASAARDHILYEAFLCVSGHSDTLTVHTREFLANRQVQRQRLRRIRGWMIAIRAVTRVARAKEPSSKDEPDCSHKHA